MITITIDESVEEKLERETLSPKPNNDSPGGFIRIRRISGDKLSKGGDQESSSVNATTTVEAEESGFLKIANVVSLAQKDVAVHASNNANLRKALESSPQQSKGQLSILKKPKYIIQRLDGPVPTSETIKFVPLNTSISHAINRPDNIISIAGQQAVTIKIDAKTMALPLSVSTTPSTISTLSSSTTQQPLRIVKISQPQENINLHKLKSAKIYDKMLQEEKLVHMFKCMGGECSFSTSNELDFNRHIRHHETDVANANETIKDYLKCAYCYIDNQTYENLISHLKLMHVFCKFCCKYCFYRAFASSYVEIHQQAYHSMSRIHVLTVNETLLPKPPSPRRLDRKSVIKPYVCVHDKCNKYFFIPEAFILHLSMHHTNIRTGFICHVCKQVAPAVDPLIEHYKSHGYFKFHCMYCIQGAATLKELHTHLSIMHCNQPPQILERTLPREISKNLSAIDQLRIKDVDAMYRTRNKSNTTEDESKKTLPLLRAKNLILPKSPIATKCIPTITSIGNQPTIVTTLSNISEPCGLSNIKILDARSLIASTVTTPTIKLASPPIQVAFKEPTTSLLRGNLINESINTNVSDHTDALSTKNCIEVNVEQITGGGNDSDSDIEIIEEYSVVSENPVNKIDKPIESVKEEQDTEESNSDATKEEACDEDPKNSMTDIKDSGYEGKELFICGYENCNEGYNDTEELRAHILTCMYKPQVADDSAEGCFICPHCLKNFYKPAGYIDHLKVHGVKKYTCVLCVGAKFASQPQAISHVRVKHKTTNTRIVPLDPTKLDGHFMVHPIGAAADKSKKKMGKQQIQISVPENEKTVFTPSEIDKLPLQAIYPRAVQCAICTYSNKVRSNMQRHLQAHLDDKTVPTSSPVNPVPCLDKKELMFNKMVNLAMSSHEKSRMGGIAKTEEDNSLPKFVPEHQRYVCGVPECNYLSFEEAMLRHHIKALHSDEMYFRCPHCPPPQDPSQNIAFDKMAVHLKLHDSRLYKCSHCIYYHFHRHVVERHLTDKHPDKRPFVKVIRELASDTEARTEAQSQNTVPEPEEIDPDGNTWKCNLCDFKTMYRTAVQHHCVTDHGEKGQFKCKCGFTTLSKPTFTQHRLSNHMYDPNYEYTLIYQRIKGSNKKSDTTESQSSQEELPFDTTPLWRRDSNRIRHIRGILLEEEEEESKSSTKRKNEADSPSKAGKAKGSPETKRSRSSVEERPEGGFGPFGTPIGDSYSCPLCTQFKSKYRSDLRDHLFREIKYYRWICRECDYKCVARTTMVKHMQSRHPNISMDIEALEQIESNETWVKNVLETQGDLIKKDKEKAAAAAKAVETSEVIEQYNNDEDCVIETPDDYNANETKEEEGNNSDEDKEVITTQPLICKHCKASFTKYRGFKRHVHLEHLKRLRYVCPYCDRSSNTEFNLLQHVRSKHQNMPIRVLENPNFQSKVQLTPEFWAKEYGLIEPTLITAKKRKRNNDEDFAESRLDFNFPCDKCDFNAVSQISLRNHQRVHETKVKMQCCYCSYQTFNSTEMRQHWDLNHRPNEYKIEEAIMSTSATDSSTVCTIKRTKLEDDSRKPVITVYYCYYCDAGSLMLDIVRSHWRSLHMDGDECTMFKYREVTEEQVKCAYCAEMGTKAMLVNHIWDVHGKTKPIIFIENDGEGWMCKWCNQEFFTTKQELESHQRKYHSHLQAHFKHVRRGFTCKRCTTFESMNIEPMMKHAKLHLSTYKCKYCPEILRTYNSIKMHFKASHPTLESETVLVSKLDLNKEYEVIMQESTTFVDLQLEPQNIKPLKTPPKFPSVAKKSTTKQSANILKGQIKATARKSTNNSCHTISSETSSQGFSYYDKSIDPIDLSAYNCTMVFANMNMKVNCAKLSEVFNININPTLMIKDIMKSKRV